MLRADNVIVHEFHSKAHDVVIIHPHLVGQSDPVVQQIKHEHVAQNHAAPGVVVAAAAERLDAIRIDTIRLSPHRCAAHIGNLT